MNDRTPQQIEQLRAMLQKRRESAKENPLPPPPQAQPMTWGQVLHGAVGIVKAVVAPADDELVKKRAAICQACPNAVLSAGVLCRCNLCGCATWAKVRNANEKCPDNPPRW